MATLSAAERRRYREKQKQKQGYPVNASAVPETEIEPAPPLSTPVAGEGTSNAMLVSANLPRPPPSQTPPPEKRQRVGPRMELGLQQSGDAVSSSAWKSVLRMQKRADVPADAAIRTVFDSRYPLNRVLNNAAGPGDVEKVAKLGVQESLVALKTFSFQSSVVAHLAEDLFKKSEAEHSRQVEAVRKAEEELNTCREEKAKLQKETEELVRWKMEKAKLVEEAEGWQGEKVRLDERIASLTEEKEKITQDLSLTRLALDKQSQVVKGVSAHFPDLGEGGDLVEAVDELKGSAVAAFDQGFERALQQFKVLFPGADDSGFDCDKVVVDGLIVEEEAASVPVNIAHSRAGSVERFLMSDEGLQEDVAPQGEGGSELPDDPRQE